MATNPFNLATPQPVGTPFLANNGNPNTVYNTPATPVQNTGAQPLMHNAAAVGAALPQPWAATPVFNPSAGTQLPVANIDPASAYAASQNQFWRNLSGAQRPVFDLRNSGVTNPNTAWVPVPPTVPPTTPPTTNPPSTGTGGGGGTGMPGTITPGGRENGVTVRPPVGGTWSPGTISTNQDGTGSLRNRDSVLRTNPVTSIVNGLNNLVSNAGRGLGFNGADGGFDANQFIDAVTEIFLPGDLYNQNVAGWNSLNVVNALLNSVVPGLGRVSTWLIDKLPEGNALRSWMQRNVLQNNVDQAKDPNNFMNAPQGDGDGGGRTPFNPGSVSNGMGYGSWGGHNPIITIGEMSTA